MARRRHELHGGMLAGTSHSHSPPGARLHSHAAVCGLFLPAAARVARVAVVGPADAAAAAPADKEVLSCGVEARDGVFAPLRLELQALHVLEVARWRGATAAAAR